MKQPDLESVKSIIKKLSGEIIPNRRMYNERYLHHRFSYEIQRAFGSIIMNGREEVFLHPEWPTYKSQMDIKFGRYNGKDSENPKKTKYHIDKEGSGGLIDFAIGRYAKPEMGVEFKLTNGWDNEGIVFDYLKLMHSKNPFQSVISYSVILREYTQVIGGNLERLKDHMKSAVEESIKRLGNEIAKDRKVLLLISEIDSQGRRTHWHCDNTAEGFKDGIGL